MFREFNIEINKETERFNGVTYCIHFRASEKFFHVSNQDIDGINLTEGDDECKAIKDYIFSKKSIPNSQSLTLYVDGYKQIKKLKIMEEYIIEKAEIKKQEIAQLNKYLESYK